MKNIREWLAEEPEHRHIKIDAVHDPRGADYPPSFEAIAMVGDEEDATSGADWGDPVAALWGLDERLAS